ncbi:MAG: hypothetical protein ACR2QV_08115 [Gammaproteobacteria bacterium]
MIVSPVSLHSATNTLGNRVVLDDLSLALPGNLGLMVGLERRLILQPLRAR